MIQTWMWIGGWAASLALAFFVGRDFGSPQVLTASSVPADMGLASRNALGHGSPMMRLGQSAQVLQHLNAENLEEVLAVYEMMLTGLGDCDLRIFSDAWAQFDPRGAFDHAMGWEWSHKRVVGSDAAIRSWAIRDPIEAAAALPDIVAENSRIQTRIIDNFIVGWAHSGQPGLDEYIEGMNTQSPEKICGTGSECDFAPRRSRSGARLVGRRFARCRLLLRSKESRFSDRPPHQRPLGSGIECGVGRALS